MKDFRSAFFLLREEILCIFRCGKKASAQIE